LADHRDLDAAALEAGGRVEHLLVPLGVAHVAGQKRKREFADQLLDPLGAIGELPMGGHGLDAERVHDLDHVRALGGERGVGALPGVAAVEQQGLAGPLGADRLDQGRQAVDAADLAVGPSQRRVILRCQDMGLGGAGRDPELAQEVGAGEVGRLAERRADPKVDRGLAEVDRHELGVDVGEVQKGDLANRLEAQQIVLGDFLLRQRPAQPRGRAGDRGGGGGQLKQITPADHELSVPQGLRSTNRGARAARPPNSIAATRLRQLRTAGVSTGRPMPRLPTNSSRLTYSSEP
jgi:hypothetical protein